MANNIVSGPNFNIYNSKQVLLAKSDKIEDKSMVNSAGKVSVVILPIIFNHNPNLDDSFSENELQEAGIISDKVTVCKNTKKFVDEFVDKLKQLPGQDTWYVGKPYDMGKDVYFNQFDVVVFIEFFPEITTGKVNVTFFLKEVDQSAVDWTSKVYKTIYIEARDIKGIMREIKAKLLPEMALTLHTLFPEAYQYQDLLAQTQHELESSQSKIESVQKEKDKLQGQVVDLKKKENELNYFKTISYDRKIALDTVTQAPSLTVVFNKPDKLSPKMLPVSFSERFFLDVHPFYFNLATQGISFGTGFKYSFLKPDSQNQDNILIKYDTYDVHNFNFSVIDIGYSLPIPFRKNPFMEIIARAGLNVGFTNYYGKDEFANPVNENRPVIGPYGDLSVYYVLPLSNPKINCLIGGGIGVTSDFYGQPEGQSDLVNLNINLLSVLTRINFEIQKKK